MKNFICLVLLCFGLGLTVMAYPTDSTSVNIEYVAPAVMPEVQYFVFETATWQPSAPKVQVGKADVIVEKTLDGYPDIKTKPPLDI